MVKLNEEMIGKIQSYPEDKNNTEIWNELWLNRKTVRKYRQLKGSIQQQATDALSGKEEQMRITKKLWEQGELLVHRLWYNSLCTFLRIYPGKPLI